MNFKSILLKWNTATFIEYKIFSNCKCFYFEQGISVKLTNISLVYCEEAYGLGKETECEAIGNG